MVNKQRQKKKKLILDKDLINSLESSGFNGKIRNKAYMAPIQREILEYKKVRKKRKKARLNKLKKSLPEKKPEIQIITTPISEKPVINKEGLFSKISHLFEKKLTIPKLEEKKIPLEKINSPSLEQIQQPLTSAQVIKQIKSQEIKPKSQTQSLFPDIGKLDHHEKDEIEIIDHEPIEEKNVKKEGLFSKIKSLFKSNSKDEEDLFTLEPITASNGNNKLKDATIETQKKDDEEKENNSETSSINMLYTEKKKKII